MLKRAPDQTETPGGSARLDLGMGRGSRKRYNEINTPAMADVFKPKSGVKPAEERELQESGMFIKHLCCALYHQVLCCAAAQAVIVLGNPLWKAAKLHSRHKHTNTNTTSIHPQRRASCRSRASLGCCARGAMQFRKAKRQVRLYVASAPPAGSNRVTTSTVWVKCKGPKPCASKSTEVQAKGTSVEEQMVLLAVANTSLPVGASL